MLSYVPLAEEKRLKHVFGVGIVQNGKVLYHCEADTTSSAHAQYEIMA